MSHLNMTRALWHRPLPKGSLVSSSDEPRFFLIARPGHEQANQAAQRYSKGLTRAAINTWGTTAGSLFIQLAVLLGMFVSDPSLAYTWSWLVLAQIVVYGGLAAHQLNRDHKAYRAFVASDDIVQLDAEFVQRWDEFRQKYEVRLSAIEREAELRALFPVVLELRPLLEQRRQLSREPELQKERDEVEAHILARLRLEVELLGHRREIEREITSQDGLSESGAPEAYVQEELQRLRERRADRRAIEGGQPPDSEDN